MSLPNCYVINLDRKKSNYETFKKDWKKYFNINRISAIDNKTCQLSGKQCLKKTTLDLIKKLALDNKDNNKYIIIAEDDVYPTEKFDKYWNKILNFIKVNNNYDLIHLDIIMNLDPLIHRGRINNSVSEFNDIFFKYSKGRNTGFIIYNKLFLNKFINSTKFNEYYNDLNTPLDQKPGFTFDQTLTKLTCKELIVRQYTDKISEITGSRHYIRNYDKWYDETNNILQSQHKKYSNKTK